MPKMEMISYKGRYEHGSFQIHLHLGGDNPIPSEIVEIKTLDDAKRELEAYGAKMDELGAVSCQIVEGRAPRGFRAWEKANPFIKVNA